jgi:hypothetical protein
MYMIASFWGDVMAQIGECLWQIKMIASKGWEGYFEVKHTGNVEI